MQRNLQVCISFLRLLRSFAQYLGPFEESMKGSGVFAACENGCEAGGACSDSLTCDHNKLCITLTCAWHAKVPGLNPLHYFPMKDYQEI